LWDWVISCRTGLVTMIVNCYRDKRLSLALLVLCMLTKLSAISYHSSKFPFCFDSIRSTSIMNSTNICQLLVCASPYSKSSRYINEQTSKRAPPLKSLHLVCGKDKSNKLNQSINPYILEGDVYNEKRKAG
jgi:hypothetical protein